MEDDAVSADAVQQIADGIARVTDLFAGDALKIRPPYQSGSLARRDGNHQQRLAKVAGAWTRQPIDTLDVHAQRMCNHAWDHLRTMALATAAPKVVYSPMSLARVTLVASARAYYLLDPAVDVEERVRRVMNLVSLSLAERRNLLRAPDSSTAHPELAVVDQQVVDLVDSAEKLGFTVTSPRQDHLPYQIGSKATEGWLVGQLLATPRGDNFGSFAHKLFSAPVHAQPHTDDLLMLVPEDLSRHGMTTVRPRLTVETLAGVVAATLGGYLTAINRVSAYYGLSTERSQATALDILDTIGTLSRGEPLSAEG